MLHDKPGDWDLFCFCEHHVHAKAPLQRLISSQPRASRGCLLHPAAPADDISRHRPGSRSYFEASHAGVGVIWSPTVVVRPVDSCLLTAALPSVELRSRIVPCILSLPGLSVLIIEVYLVTQVALIDANARLLQAIHK